MIRRKTELFDVEDVLLKEGLTPLSGKPTGPIRAIAKSLEILASGSRPQWAPRLVVDTAEPSIAPKILVFATGETANCFGGRSCASLYLALQGMAVPLRHTITGTDLTCLEWWLQAMAEHATGRWGGNADGVKAIAAAQPEIWEQAQAATRAWRRSRCRSHGSVHFPTASASSCPDPNANSNSPNDEGA